MDALEYVLPTHTVTDIPAARVDSSNALPSLSLLPSKCTTDKREEKEIIEPVQVQHLSAINGQQCIQYKKYHHDAERIQTEQSVYQFADDKEREHKLRIVERLGTVSFALQSEVSSEIQQKLKTDRHRRHSSLTGTVTSSNQSGSGSGCFLGEDRNKGMVSKETKTAGSTVQWLSDAELAQLSTIELEEVMDKYLLSVMKQMVQVRSEVGFTSSFSINIIVYRARVNISASLSTSLSLSLCLYLSHSFFFSLSLSLSLPLPLSLPLFPSPSICLSVCLPACQPIS